MAKSSNIALRKGQTVLMRKGRRTVAMKIVAVSSTGGPKKRPYFKTAERVIAAYDKNPKLTSREYGRNLGLHPAYIRKTLARNGRRLINARKPL